MINEFCGTRVIGVRNGFAHGHFAYFVAVSAAMAAILAGTAPINENCCLAFELTNVRKLTLAVQGSLRFSVLDLTFVVLERMLVLNRSYPLVLVDYHLDRLVHH